MTLPMPRDPGLPCCIALLLATCPATATALAAHARAVVGSWHGTSTCVNKVAFPACHDEEVFYDVRPVGQSGDSVAVRADKVLNGAREFMGEYVLVRGPNGEWSGSFDTPRLRLRLTITVKGTHMSGALIELPAGRRARAMALQRVPVTGPPTKR